VPGICGSTPKTSAALAIIFRLGGVMLFISGPFPTAADFGLHQEPVSSRGRS
jgi:hypothetical protein